MKRQTTLSVPVAARKLGYTLKYIYDLVYSGRMKAEKVSGRWHIPVSEVNARLAKEEKVSTSRWLTWTPRASIIEKKT